MDVLAQYAGDQPDQDDYFPIGMILLLPYILKLPLDIPYYLKSLQLPHFSTCLTIN
jgi:hypothetical protein